MTTWDEQEAAADRSEAIENEAGERAAAHFATPEALVKAIEESCCLEDEDLLVEADAVCAMWNATRNSADLTISVRFAEVALRALGKFTELVFDRLCAEEQRKIERGE